MKKTQEKALSDLQIVTLTAKSQNLEELLSSIKDNNEVDEIFDLLQKKILELENIIYLNTQKENSLERQMQENNKTIKELRIENERLTLNNLKTASKNKKSSVVNLSNVDDEMNSFLSSLLFELEEAKKENQQIQDKALERLTEKELEIIQLKEELANLERHYRNDLNEKMNIITNTNNSTKSLKRAISINSSMTNSIEDEFPVNNELENNLKIELLSNEKNQLINNFSLVENSLKQKIGKLENELDVVSMEKYKLEMDKLELQKELSNNFKNNDAYYLTIEEYQSKFKEMEDYKNRIESDLRIKLNLISEEYSKLQMKYYEIENELNSQTKAFNLIEKESKKKSIEELKILESKLIDKDKQIGSNSKKIELLSKDLKSSHLENDKLKQELEKQYKTLSDYIENNIKQNDYYKEKVFQLEKSLSVAEKIERIEKNQLNNIYLSNITPTEVNDNMMTLDSIEEIDNREQKLLKEIEILNKQIKESKEEFNKSKLLYEKQILELQQHSTKFFSERTSIKKSINGEENQLSMKQIVVYSEMQKKINDLKAENNYLKGEIKLKFNEVDNNKRIYLSEIEYYKQELKYAEEIAITSRMQYASYVFEKEQELIKVNNLVKNLFKLLGVQYDKSILKEDNITLRYLKNVISESNSDSQIMTLNNEINDKSK